ncbi:MAG: hypothetical protein ACYC6N_05330 [Pirellulaceae bacterium]
MQRHPFTLLALGILVFMPRSVTRVAAQMTDAAPPQITIADEPRFIDPVGLMPEQLAAKVSVDFHAITLNDLVTWFREQQQLVVLLDKSAMAEEEIYPTDVVSDHLEDAPVYLLLDRLRFHGLAWYFRDDILHITTPEVARENQVTVPYLVGDLFDQGIKPETLHEVITSTVAPEHWEDVGGAGVLGQLGDVLLVRQTDEWQRHVQGLLAAVRSHGRQTFICEPPQHTALREKLSVIVSVDFNDTPLDEAIGALAKQSGADIRLDSPALRDVRIRDREPVTLKLTERKLETVLHALFMDLKLTWLLQDGVLWVTTAERADEHLKTAVYDVRDLCANDKEAEALVEAITSQTDASTWDESGGPGALEFAKPGTLVVMNHEPVLMEVLRLLETYRNALRTSKPRAETVVDPEEVITVYYRMHATMANDLIELLPKLVQPGTWRSETQPEGKGEMFRAASAPELFDQQGQLALQAGKGDGGKDTTLIVARAVLIIRQTRAAHEEIAEVIRRIETGDAVKNDNAIGGMGGFGGFFSVPEPDRRTQ